MACTTTTCHSTTELYSPFPWRQPGSNQWPYRCKRCALPNWAMPPFHIFRLTPDGFEPPTSSLSTIYSNRWVKGFLVKWVVGIEPTPSAWKAEILPLYYTHSIENSTTIFVFFKRKQKKTRRKPKQTLHRGISKEVTQLNPYDKMTQYRHFTNISKKTKRGHTWFFLKN